MRLSELGQKELVNLSDGIRYGAVHDADLVFDEKNGEIKGIIVPDIYSKSGFWGSKESIQFPWTSIRKIGEDIIIFET